MIFTNDDIQPGDSVMNLNTAVPFTYRVTRVVDGPQERLLQVAQLYGEDLVPARAFFKVADSTPTNDELFRCNEARARLRAESLSEEGY